VYLLQDDALEQIKSLVPHVDWNTALRVWSLFADFPHTVTVPKPVVVTTAEEQFAEKLQLAAVELNSVNSAPESYSGDCETCSEEFCDPFIQSSIQGDESMSRDENFTIEKDVAVSHLDRDTKKLTDESEGNISVGQDDSSDQTELSSIAAEKCVQAKETTSLPSFRATCYRTGNRHCFQSPEAAAHFGGAVHDYFGWKVDLTNYDIEVVLCIEDTDVRVGIALTNQSLHRRHITHFGKTTLRPTVAHAMLR